MQELTMLVCSIYTPVLPIQQKKGILQNWIKQFNAEFTIIAFISFDIESACTYFGGTLYVM